VLGESDGVSLGQELFQKMQFFFDWLRRGGGKGAMGPAPNPGIFLGMAREIIVAILLCGLI